ncbi:uncharacterized protein BXZ73DRAFT_90875 [Epithele typhae]|uniref:uncharacterized protein n=1 Tax=Epithele typhae TaxID=378194 RepID=UPI002008DDC8|nr:uncharacterized protein BXZ73DRAFT_90875 [Epithele typhae]KAH9926547.1 hypothetical protein BXZ73DRAFT_90875 [Epithele typhae]
MRSSVQDAVNSRDLSYSEVACVAILTWDVLIMFSEEVEHIWRRTWAPGKVLYLIARYLPWLVQLALLAINVNGTTGLFFTPAQCGQWQIVQGVLLQLIVTTVDVILITRVLALYNRNRILVYSLGALFLAELASLCYILAVVTPRLTYNDECYVTSSPPIFQYFWIISLAFETVLFVLTIGKFIDAVRQGWGKGPVMQQFVADGTWAYTLIFVVMLINMMLYKLVRSTLTGICYTRADRARALQGSRLILNPRRASTIHSSSGDITRSQLDIELSRLSRLSAPPRPRRSHGIAVTIERTTTTDNLEAHISLDCVPDSPWSATKGGESDVGASPSSFTSHERERMGFGV